MISEKMHRLYQARKQNRMILHQLYLTSSQIGLVCESEAGSEGGLASSQGGEGGSIEGLASSQGLNPTDSGSEGSCDEGLDRPVIVTDSGRIVISQEENVESSSNLTLEELMSQLSEDDHDLSTMIKESEPVYILAYTAMISDLMRSWHMSGPAS